MYTVIWMDGHTSNVGGPSHAVQHMHQRVINFFNCSD